MSCFSYLNVYSCFNGRLTEDCLSGIQLHTFELSHFAELKVLPGLPHLSNVSPSPNPLGFVLVLCGDGSGVTH